MGFVVFSFFCDALEFFSLFAEVSVFLNTTLSIFKKKMVAMETLATRA